MKKDEKSLNESGQISLRYLIDSGIIPEDKSEYFRSALNGTCVYIEGYAVYKNQQAKDGFQIMKYIGIYALVSILTILILGKNGGQEAIIFAYYSIISFVSVFFVWIFFAFGFLFLGLFNQFLHSQKIQKVLDLGARFIFFESKKSRDLEKQALALEENVKGILSWESENSILYDKFKKHYEELSKENKKDFQKKTETAVYVFDVTSAVIKNPANRVFIEHSMGIPQI